MINTVCVFLKYYIILFILKFMYLLLILSYINIFIHFFGIKNDVSGAINNAYVIFDVSHFSTYTSVKFVGTSTGNISSVIPTGDFAINIGKSGHWVAFDTYDPQTCCGLSAYGVMDADKQIAGENNYHTDFRRVFNNPKNTLQSNRDRDWRYNYGLFNSIGYITGVSSTSGRLRKQLIVPGPLQDSTSPTLSAMFRCNCIRTVQISQPGADTNT